jgi:hypothetical protein
MLLHRRAFILPVGRFSPINQHIDGALPSAERHHYPVIGADGHEAGRGDQLDGENKQSQRGEKAASAFRLSDCPQHDAARLAAGGVAVIRANRP